MSTRLDARARLDWLWDEAAKCERIGAVRLAAWWRAKAADLMERIA